MSLRNSGSAFDSRRGYISTNLTGKRWNLHQLGTAETWVDAFHALGLTFDVLFWIARFGRIYQTLIRPNLRISVLKMSTLQELLIKIWTPIISMMRLLAFDSQKKWPCLSGLKAYCNYLSFTSFHSKVHYEGGSPSLSIPDTLRISFLWTRYRHILRTQPFENLLP